MEPVITLVPPLPPPLPLSLPPPLPLSLPLPLPLALPQPAPAPAHRTKTNTAEVCLLNRILPLDSKRAPSIETAGPRADAHVEMFKLYHRR